MAQERILVVGAGLMGHGIALVCARAGHNVAVHDPFAAALETLHDRIRNSLLLLGESDPGTVLKRVTVSASLAEGAAGATIVFEAAPEKPDLKRALFADIEPLVGPDCVLASNTSVIPITTIMEGLERKERALGTHWWNPPHQIPLVEVIRTQWTGEEAMVRMVSFLDHAGKTPVRVEKDVPGFIGNRLQHALWREAISLVENGICSAEAVDTVVKASFGRRLAVLGPLENADLVGTDLTLDIHKQVLHDLERSQDPSPYLENLVEKGRLGMKTGEGFSKWTPEEADAVRQRVGSHLRKLETILK